MWWYNKKVAGCWWWVYWCRKHVEHRSSEIKLNKLWHQFGLLLFNHHNDARSKIHKMKFFVECSIFQMFSFVITVIYYHSIFTSLSECWYFPFWVSDYSHYEDSSVCVFRTVTAALYIRAHVSPGVNNQFPVLITHPTGVLDLQILHPHLFIKAYILTKSSYWEFLLFFEFRPG